MKHVVCRRFGSPKVLKMEETQKPIPKDNEVLIRVKATSANAGDRILRSFDLPLPKVLRVIIRNVVKILPRKPKVLGMEVSGTIESIGKDVTKYKVGDDVIASTFAHNDGGYAEYKCMPEVAMMTTKPKNLSYEEAAVLMVGGGTALWYLKLAGIKKGMKVLINGASGSVGTYAIQIAKYYGCEVTAVCSKRNDTFVRSLGADKVIDYNVVSFSDIIEPYDIFFDCFGNTKINKTKHLVKQGGAYIHLLSFKEYQEIDGIRFYGGVAKEELEELAFLKKLTEDGYIKPFIDKNYTLENIQQAHEHLDTRRKRGNISITVQ